MTKKAVLSIIRSKPGMSKTELCEALDKRGDRRTRSAQFKQIAELCRFDVIDRGEGHFTSLFVRDNQ